MQEDLLLKGPSGLQQPAKTYVVTWDDVRLSCLSTIPVPFCSGSFLGTQNPYCAACICLTSCARHRYVSQTCQYPEPIYWEMHESGDILQLGIMPSFSGSDSWLPRMPQANGTVERVSCRSLPTRRHTRYLLDQTSSFAARETADDVQLNSMEAPSRERTRSRSAFAVVSRSLTATSERHASPMFLVVAFSWICTSMLVLKSGTGS